MIEIKKEKDIDILEIKVNKCPHCKNNHFIKYGRYKDEQRYKCKVCNKTFSSRTNTPWYHSKKSIYVWAQYYKLLFNKQTLRLSCKELNISLPTSFAWRHKILSSLSKEVKFDLLRGAVHIQRRFVKFNNKGQKAIYKDQPHDIWVYLASDNRDNILGKPVCVDRWNEKNFREIIYKKIDKKSYVHQIGDRFVQSIISHHNYKLKRIIDLNNIKKLRRAFNIFEDLLRIYHGIASKYIRRYLNIVEVFAKNKKYELNNIITSAIGEQNYLKTSKLKEEEIIKIQNICQ